MTKIAPETLKQLFEEYIPFNKFLGLEVAEVGDGQVRLELPFRSDFVGDPELPALHGGVMSAMLDTAGGLAVWSMAGAVDRVSTVDLRVDYLRPGRLDRLITVGKVVRMGNRVGVAELRAFQPGAEDKPIGAGMGVYNVRRAKQGDVDWANRVVRDDPG